MFTGIIESLGRVAAVKSTGAGSRLSIEAGEISRAVRTGESVAVDGVCLTVVRADPPLLEFDAVPETLRRSTLGGLAPGTAVNLERALAVGDRLSGHFVQGHVDGMGRVRSLAREGNSTRVWIDSPPELLRYIVEKGSIAVDGVSLTITACDPGGFEVALVPHTSAVTTLGRKASGESVNLEVDMVAKYIERLMEGRQAE